MRLFLLVFLWGSLTSSSFLIAQSPLSLLAYNVEILFDTLSAGPHDAEFLPASPRRWTASRYWGKLHSLAQVIAGVGQEPLPALVGLCEVESDTVLSHLTCRSALRTAGYRYFITHSPDHRGLNVALLYRPGRFRPLVTRSVRIPLAQVGASPTRDVLYVSGLVSPTDTLHLFLCHLPSRAGSTRRADRHRALAAQTLRTAIDSLLILSPEAKIVVMGDFNAESSDPVFTRHLRAHSPSEPISRGDNHLLTTTMVQNLWHPRADSVAGSYRFRGEWMYLDHILISTSLLRATSGLRCPAPRMQVAAFPFLLTPDAGHGGLRPRRTWQGPVYRGGYSDHLPVFLDLRIR